LPGPRTRVRHQLRGWPRPRATVPMTLALAYPEARGPAVCRLDHEVTGVVQAASQVIGPTTPSGFSSFSLWNWTQTSWLRGRMRRHPGDTERRFQEGDIRPAPVGRGLGKGDVAASVIEPRAVETIRDRLRAPRDAVEAIPLADERPVGTRGAEQLLCSRPDET
jgi:hypothetical protein